MFETGWGFQEIILILVIALIVVGPERLPTLARKAGLWFGKLKRFVSNVKEDVEKEFKADELRRVLKEQAESTGLHEIIEETRDAVEEQQAYLINAITEDAVKQQQAEQKKELEKNESATETNEAKTTSEPSVPAVDTAEAKAPTAAPATQETASKPNNESPGDESSKEESKVKSN